MAHKKLRVLVVYREVPESLSLYEAYTDDRTILECHGLLVNCNMPDSLATWLLEWLPKQKLFYCGVKRSKKVNKPKSAYDYIVVTGFAL